MRELSIQGVSRRRGVRTTTPDRRAAPAPDLVKRDFKASRPDEIWVADITYIPTHEGWLFLAALMDLYSRRIVGCPGSTPSASRAPASPRAAAVPARRSTTRWKRDRDDQNRADHATAMADTARSRTGTARLDRLLQRPPHPPIPRRTDTSGSPDEYHRNHGTNAEKPPNHAGAKPGTLHSSRTSPPTARPSYQSEPALRPDDGSGADTCGASQSSLLPKDPRNPTPRNQGQITASTEAGQPQWSGGDGLPMQRRAGSVRRDRPIRGVGFRGRGMCGDRVVRYPPSGRNYS